MTVIAYPILNSRGPAEPGPDKRARGAGSRVAVQPGLPGGAPPRLSLDPAVQAWFALRAACRAMDCIYAEPAPPGEAERRRHWRCEIASQTVRAAESLIVIADARSPLGAITLLAQAAELVRQIALHAHDDNAAPADQNAMQALLCLAGVAEFVARIEGPDALADLPASREAARELTGALEDRRRLKDAAPGA